MFKTKRKIKFAFPIPKCFIITMIYSLQFAICNKIKRTFALYLLLLLLPTATFSQTFQRTFGDSDAVIASYSTQTNDGGYILSGYFQDTSSNYDVYLVKTNASGNLSWSKIFEGAAYGQGYHTIQTSDGGYIIVGYTGSFGADYFDVYVIKTDASGNLLWSKRYGMSGADYGYFIQQTTDGGYIIVGESAALGSPSDVYLIKIDTNGNLLWSKTYGGPLDDVGYCVRQTTDGGYIISGRTASYGTGGMAQKWDVYLLKTDANGNLTWSKSFGVYNVPEYGYSVVQTTDGGYAVIGMTSVYGSPADVYLIKTDVNGNLLWSKAYGESNNTEYGNSIQQTTDGGFIIGGYTWPLGGTTFGGADVYLIKTDADGNHLWSKIYGGASGDWGRSVQQTTDGGYEISGETNSFGTGSSDLYIIKTDANGNCGGCNEMDYPTLVSLPATIVGSGGIVNMPATVVNTCNPVISSGSTQTNPCANFPPVADFSASDSTICVGNCISFTDISSNSPTSWVWTFTGATPDTSTAQFPFNICYYTAGTYTVTLIASNSNGLDTTIKTSLITVIANPVINVMPNPATICADDSIVLTATGAINYTWSPAAGLSSTTGAMVTASPPSNTTYTIIGTTNGCADTTTVTVIINTAPTPTIIGSSSYCAGDSAILQTGVYSSYQWSNSDTSQIIYATVIDNPITVTVTDSNGCTATASTSVTENPLPNAYAGEDTAICNGQSVILIATGGTDYIWNNGDTIQEITITPIASTYYTVTVSNIFNCKNADSVYVTIHNNPIPVITSSGPVSFCQGQTILLDAGNFNAYTWSMGGASQIIPVSNSGIYAVTVTDNNGCTGDTNVTVTVHTLPVPQIISDLPASFCQGDTAVLSVNGDSTYLWSNGATTQNIFVSSSGNYMVTVTDNYGCTGTDHYTVTVIPPVFVDVSISIFPTDTVCPGENIIFTATPVNPGFNPVYQWRVNNVPVGTNSANFISGNIYNGDMITCNLLSSEACVVNIGSDTVIANVYPVPQINVYSDVVNGCVPLQVHFIESSANQNDSYFWNFGDGGISGIKNTFHTYQDTGTFDVFITITTQQGCTQTEHLNDFITVYPRPEARFSASPSVASVINSHIEFNNYSTGAVNYLWLFGDGHSSVLFEPYYNFQNQGDYQIWQIAESSHGCKDSTFANVRIEDEYTFYAPTCFSPDNDGINEIFKVFGNGINTNNFEMYIYDRWGEIIYKTDNIETGWDGRAKNHEMVPGGTYTWLVVFNYLSGKKNIKSGTVTVIR